MLYDVPDIVHDDVWRAVVQAAADISMALERQRQEDREDASAADCVLKYRVHTVTASRIGKGNQVK